MYRYIVLHELIEFGLIMYSIMYSIVLMYSICAQLSAVICFGLLPFLDMGAKQLI